MASFSLGRLPRIEFGAGRVSLVPEIVARHGRRVLLVTGGRSFRGTLRHRTLLDGLADRGVEVAGEVTITGEPTPDTIDTGVAAHRESGVEVVLGIGGGSVLDAAKAIAGLVRTGTSVRDHLEGVGPGVAYAGPAVPWVAVPTTAGTGSEVTRNAVLTERGEGGFKRSFRDERLVAADAIVDPDLLAGASRTLIAANGMDALTQLLEAYVSQRASPMTDALALSGIEAVREGLLAWHADPEGPGAAVARERMAYAALLSGICLANAGLGAVHGLASPLGALFPIPHGAACGAVLWQTVAANISALEAREPGSPALGKYAAVGRQLGGDSLVRTLGAMARELEVQPLSTFGVGEADIARIVADSRGSSMRTNPIALTDDDIGRILTASL
jgi:alcohol dehydrogenase class IV